ncbi:MAG: 7-cyano-7-deazaguanine synthase [Anaerolineales bacterium]|nr:7-cyano-7-deazaguanine synthase [Anaerolineales bacterium]
MNKAIAGYELYLFFSYLPRFSKANLSWLNCDFDNDFGRGIDNETWWVKEGVRSLKKTFADEVACTDPNADHIVLLSGGMDSRAILGGLLDNLPKSRIIAATYGIPGSWDWEIAKAIAKKNGIHHELFDISNDRWNVDQLVAAAVRLKHPVSVHQSYVRQKVNNHFGINCVYWSGLAGDSLAGSDLPKIPSRNKREAIRRHINLYPTHNYKDTEFQEEVIDWMFAGCPWDRLARGKYLVDQQLDLGIRQNLLTRPIVIVEGYKFMTPFLTRCWTHYISNAPYKWLFGLYLYRRVIQDSYPRLSKFPSTATAGMSLFASKGSILVGKAIAKIKPYLMRSDVYRSHPRTNYINWTEALRHKTSLHNMVYETLQDLKKRGIFDNKELDSWWQDHLTRKMDYTTLLMNLSSLELLFKAGVMSPSEG